jgi:hypothetical protein
MEPALDSLHETALRSSKRATMLFLAAKHMLAAEALLSALELNRIAIEEYERALNTVDFIQRYEPPDQ